MNREPPSMNLPSIDSQDNSGVLAAAPSASNAVGWNGADNTQVSQSPPAISAHTSSDRPWDRSHGLDSKIAGLLMDQGEIAEQSTCDPQDMQAWHSSQRKRAVPSWLVSFIVHVVILLLLAIAPIAHYASGPLTIVLANSDGVAVSEFELASDSGDSAVEIPQEQNLASVETSAMTESLIESLDSLDVPLGASGLPSLSNLGLQEGFSGRSGAMKSTLLMRYGGTTTTEAAVEAGLKWLVKNQRSDGGWSLVGPYSDGGAKENRTAATAMALNAFLGAGYTHKAGKYMTVVDNGLRFLMARQDKEGWFSANEPSQQRMYAQALATIAICEAYGMSGDSKLRIATTRAIKYAEWSQSKYHGWRYEPKEDADLSVTGWFLMGLMTAKMAGLSADEKNMRGVSEYLDSVDSYDGSRYSYTDSEVNRPSLSMTAVGLLCRQYLGWPKSHPALLQAIEVDLLPNAPDESDNVYSVYFWYYATQVLHHVGGDAWTKWNSKMRVVLPAMQEKAGREVGSWSPEQDQFGPSGGRLYTTCFNIYCLEVYYRHLALYDLDRNGKRK